MRSGDVGSCLCLGRQKPVTDLDETHIFFCGIAIGYRDEEDPVNGFDRKREPLESKIQFLGFE